MGFSDGAVVRVGSALLRAFNPGCVKQWFQLLLFPVQFCLSTIDRKHMT